MKTNKMKYILTFAICLFFSVTWSQKKELRSAKKLLADSLYSETKDFLIKNQNIFASADQKTISSYNLMFFDVYRNLGEFENALEKLNEIKNDPKLIKDYEIQSQNLKADVVNSAIKDTNEKKYLSSVEKLFLAYMINTEDNIEYLYYAASNSVNGNDYETALEYYLILKEIKFTGIKIEFYITEIETNNEIQLSSEQELELYSKDKKFTNPVKRATPSLYPEIVKNIALIYTNLGQKDKAISAVKEARVENPTDLPLILTEANLYIDLGDKEKFKDLINQALDQDPDNATLYFNLGVVSAEMGENINAQEYYIKAIELDPKLEAPYLNLVALILEGDEEIREKMDALGNSRSDNARYDAFKLERKELFEQCVPILKQLIQINNKNTEAIQTLMNIYVIIEDYEGAKEMKALME
jgi:tetratricopeptide (TPR) repeat protein